MSRRNVLILAIGAFAVLLIAAWVDGGTEPLHPITAEVAVPEHIQ